MIERRPNLFVIGSMKSGTTYLAKLLESHPSIFICRPEEPSYFVDPSQLRRLWPWIWRQGYWRSEESYLKLFESAKDEVVLGEASTSYAKMPLIKDIPRRIRRFNPDARLIYVMRDPVERTLSHYWHAVGYDSEHRSILEAVKNERHFRDVSDYAMQLAAYFEYFDRDQVKTLTFEEVTRDPAATMKSIYGWLKVDDSFVCCDARPENVTPPVVRQAIYGGIAQRLQRTRVGEMVGPFVPQSLRRVGNRLTRRTVIRRDVDTSEAVEYLRSTQYRQTEELTKLLGRQFPEWTTLYGDAPTRREPAGANDPTKGGG
jgi:hypothetical protein